MSSAVHTQAKPTSKDYKVTLVPLTKISDVSINIRFANNLDIPTMKDEIALSGRVKDPIYLWLPAEEWCQSNGVTVGDYVVIRGNRRTLASKEIVSEPDQWTATLVDTVKQIPAYLYDKLTPTEAEEMVLDHNSMKRIAKSEIVNSIFRRFLSGKSEMDIILEMHRIIGEDLVNKGDKVREMEQLSDPKKRRDFARKWLHTFVGNYLIRAVKLGPFVREQVLFHFKSGDGLLEAGETIHFVANTSALQALSAAKTEDDKDGSWQSGLTGIIINGNGVEAQGGGNTTRGVIEELINNHKSGKKAATDDGEPKPLSKKDLADRKDSFQSKAVISAFRMALGHEVAALADEDIRAARREVVENIIKEMIDTIKDDKVKLVLCQIVDADVNPTKVREGLATLA